MTRYRKKPRKCPECGSARIATVLYGNPALTADLEEKLAGGRVVLGGCTFERDAPVWRCVECCADLWIAHKNI